MKSRRTSNIEHRTSNAQLMSARAIFPAFNSTFDVRFRAARAFSFAEVMFAVVILGIGFIMVAAVFPVAIQQTQATGEENLAAELARQASNSLNQLPTTLTNPVYVSGSAANTPASVQTQLLFPPTVKNYLLGSPDTISHPLVNGGTAVHTVAPPPAVVVPFTGTQWDLIKSNVILPSDPRFAFVMFYKRENNSSAAELIVVAVTIRNRSTYTSADIINQATAGTVVTAAGDLKSRSASVPYYPLTGVTQTLICPDTISLNVSNAEGSYVEIPYSAGGILASAVGIGPGSTPTSPQGRSYSVGRSINGNGSPYELNPGGSLELVPGSTGLWGTTSPSGGIPAVVPTTPVTDATGSHIANCYSPATLQPTVAYAALQTTADAPAGRIWLTSTPPYLGATYSAPLNAVPGAFVIIADDFPFSAAGQATGGLLQDYNLPFNLTQINPATNAPFLPIYSVGSLNGRIFRLGAAATKDINGKALPAGTFNLDPAYGMRPASTATYSPDTIPNPDMVANSSSQSTFRSFAQYGAGCAKVYIIGAGATTPGSTASYSGAAQDIGAFASYFQVR